MGKAAEKKLILVILRSGSRQVAIGGWDGALFQSARPAELLVNGGRSCLAVRHGLNDGKDRLIRSGVSADEKPRRTVVEHRIGRIDGLSDGFNNEVGRQWSGIGTIRFLNDEAGHFFLRIRYAAQRLNLVGNRDAFFFSLSHFVWIGP